jgi:DNA polymerase III epsilon subunit family exonuclease
MPRLESSIHFNSEDMKNILTFFPKGVVVFDLEMTGLTASLDKIIEIAALKIDSKGAESTFHSFVNPLIPIPAHTYQYHQITDEMVQEAPTIKNVVIKFQNFIENKPLVAHSAQFDISFLVHAYHQFNLDVGINEVYDSCRFARAVFKKERNKDKKPKNFTLSGIAEYFNIEFTHHQAMDDAYVSLKSFSECLQKSKHLGSDFNIKNASYLFKMSDFKKGADYILPNKFESLREHLVKREMIEIKYKGGSHGNEWRSVKPIAILNLPKGLVLYGECQLSKLNKTFAIKKIKKVKGLVE